MLCSGTVRKASLVDTVRAASTAGFDGVSLYHREYVAAREAGWSDRALVDLLDGEGIAVAELDGTMRWLPGDGHGPSLDEFVEPFVVGGTRIFVGASCGSAVRLSADGSVGDIVARADRVLYAAKHRRRRLTG